MADDFDRFAFNREATDWEELASLGALDDAPPPNPRFARALRGELMNRAEALSQPSTQLGRRHAAMQASLAAPPIQIHRKRWDRTLMFEAIAVAVLLVALIGSITMRGGNGGGNETAGGVINPPVLENEHTSWMYRQDAARTNVSADSGPVTTPKLDWRATVNDGVIAVADGVIVTLGTNSTTMQGWSVETGESIWTTTLDFMNPGQAAAGDGYVFLSPLSRDGSVAAYDLKTGSQVWTSTSISGFGSQPAVYDGKLYYLAFDRTLQVVDTLSGKSLWSVDVTAEVSKSTPNADEDSTYTNVMNNFAVSVGDGVVLVTGGDENVTAYDVNTHEVKWTLKTEGDKVTTPVIADGTVYLTSTRYNPTYDSKDDPHAAGWTYSINAATGEVVWIRSSDPFSSIGGLIGSDGILLGSLTIISRVDGKDLGKLPGDEVIGYYGGWTFGKDSIYSVDGDGNLISWSYDSASHSLSERWSAYLAIEPYESSTGLAIVGDRLIARGPNGTLVALSADSTAPDSATASGTPAALDFSGLPPCSPPSAIDYLNVTGDPANTLQTTSAVLGDDPVASGVNSEYVSGSTQTEMGDWTVTIVDDPTRQPWFSTDEVPTGTEASADVIAGIESTLQAIKDCDHPGVTTDVSGFYSEDFYRRSWVQAQIEQLAESDPIGSLAYNAGVYSLNEIQAVTVLPDGRVAVLGQPGINPEPNDFSMFVVFVQQGDTWVIDESIRVGLFALMG